MAAAQQADAEMAAYRTAITGMQLEDIACGPGDTTLLCDVSRGQPRPVVPDAWRRTVFDAFQGLSHPGIRSTKRLITDRFVWHGITKQVGKWAAECVRCQQSKIQLHTKAPLQTFSVPPRRFDHINIDIVGPLPPSRGYTYLLTVVDRFTRWPEAIPMHDATTPTCARALASHWLARFGIPQTCLPTGENNSPLSYGQHSHSSSASNYTTLRPTIHRQMAWWNVSTDT